MKNRLSVEDRLDLQELMAKYAWGLDTGDLDALQGLFLETGCLDHPPPFGLYNGRAEIRKFFEQLWYDRPGWFIGRQHIGSHFLITPEDDGARIKAMWTVVRRDQNTGECFIHAVGHWDAACVQRDGRWYFKSLRIFPWYDKDTPWVGEERARYVRKDVRNR